MLNIKGWFQKYFSKTREDVDAERTDPDESLLLIDKDEDDVMNDENGEVLKNKRSRKYVEQDSNIKLFKYNRPALLRRILKRSPYYFLPIALWLPSYDWRENLLPDIIAGIGVGCMLIPQALAYALLAGVRPEIGLYTAWMPVYIFGCLTTSRHVSFGPDALGALLVGLYMEKHNTEDVSSVATLYSFMCGVILVSMGVLRVGFLDNILSRPLLAGFVNAVAIIIIVLQLHPLFGITPPEGHADSWTRFSHFVVNVGSYQLTTFLLALMCLFILFGISAIKLLFPKFERVKYLIGPLIVFVIGTLLGYFLNLEQKGVALLGEVTSVFLTPRVPKFDLFNTADITDCVVICVIGFVETIVAAKIYAKKNGYSVSPNRELVAIGMSNMVGSFFHSYPCFGSLTRSAMADFLGNKTQIYSFVSATMVLITILALNQAVYYLPRVVMSSIILVAAFSLFELEDLFFFIRIRAWIDVSLLVVTFLVTLTLGVDLGILISIGISLLLVLKHTSFPHIAILGKTQTGNFVDIFMDKTAKNIPGVVIVRIDESLYFANMEQIKDMFKRIEIHGSHYAHPTDSKEETPVRAIVVHARNITEMDASAIQILSEMMQDYQKQDIFVCFAKLSPSLKKSFLQSGIIGSLGGNRVFESVSEAIEYINREVLLKHQ